MIRLDNKKCLVWDRGGYAFFAQALGGENGFSEVFYYNATQDFMAKSQDAIVGEGFSEIERIDNFFSYLDKVDTVVFPDIGDGDLVHFLKSKGYNVWGSDNADILEMDRWRFLKLLQDIGSPVPDTTRVIGIDQLRRELRDRQDVYLKTSFYRGDFETVHCERYDIMKPWIDDLALRIGPHSQDIEILIQEPIEGVEPGYDGYVIDGRFPKVASWGWEAKDSSFIGKTCEFEDMPHQIRDTAKLLLPALKTLGARCNFSTEVRIDKSGTAYLTDPTIRVPSPPGESMARVIKNWAEIVHHGARGELIEPEFGAKYFSQIMLKSTYWVLENFLAIYVPKEYRDYVQLRRGVIIDGQAWCVPSGDLEIIGSAIGVGDSPSEAIDMALEVAESIEALELSYDKQAKRSLLEKIDEGEKVLEQEF